MSSWTGIFWGKFNEAYQTDGNLSLSEIVSDTVTTPGADHGEAGIYAATLAKLNDGLATDLNDAVGPVGPGNVTWTFQWDFNIPGGGTVIISKDKLLVVPEPSPLFLVATGLVGYGLLRRRASRRE